MTELEKLGLKEEDFMPKEKPEAIERIEILEEAFAEFVSEVLNDD